MKIVDIKLINGNMEITWDTSALHPPLPDITVHDATEVADSIVRNSLRTFVLSTIAPDGMPVAMGVYPTMEIAEQSALLSGLTAWVTDENPHYRAGWIGDTAISIVEITGIATEPHSVFRN